MQEGSIAKIPSCPTDPEPSPSRLSLWDISLEGLSLESLSLESLSLYGLSLLKVSRY